MAAEEAFGATASGPAGGASHGAVEDDLATMPRRQPPNMPGKIWDDCPPGLMLWRGVRGTTPEPSAEGEHASARARQRPPRAGHPVVLVARQDEEQGLLTVFDGVESFAVHRSELYTVGAQELEGVARMFTHFAASPAPSTPTPAASVAPLSWLTPGGLCLAEQGTFEVPRTSLRFVIGRGGGTIRRLEAALGVLIGAIDGTEGTARVSLCSPGPRLAMAERVVRLVAAGHRSIVSRVEQWGPQAAVGDGVAGNEEMGHD